MNSCNFVFENTEFVVKQIGSSSYEIDYAKTGEKVSNMKEIAQKYFATEGIDVIKGHTYDVLKVLMAYVLYKEQKNFGEQK